MKVKLQPPSGAELAPFNPILPPAAISQVVLLANPLKVDFTHTAWTFFHIRTTNLSVFYGDFLPLLSNALLCVHLSNKIPVKCTEVCACNVTRWENAQGIQMFARHCNMNPFMFLCLRKKFGWDTNWCLRWESSPSQKWGRWTTFHLLIDGGLYSYIFSLF